MMLANWIHNLRLPGRHKVLAISMCFSGRILFKLVYTELVFNPFNFGVHT